MTTLESEPPERQVVEQHNHGSGPFVAGDNNGHIVVETLDAQTKTYLKQMSIQAPGLAKLLARALREGTISPDAAHALLTAAHHINEDVAEALWNASRSINEDVAHQLFEAGRNINPDVAMQMSQAADDLLTASQKLSPDDISRSVARFEDCLAALERLTGDIGWLQTFPTDIARLQAPDRPLGRIEHITTALGNTAERIEATVTPPPPRLIVDRTAQAKAFIAGLICGVLLVVYLAHR